MKRPIYVSAAGVLLVVLPLLSACSREPADPIAAARKRPDAPTWVSAPTGTDCGVVELGQRRTLPEKNLQCLTAADKSGQPAYLAWTEQTTEGDPIPSFARTTKAGVDFASTSAYDSYASERGWTESECSEIGTLPGCADGIG